MPPDMHALVTGPITGRIPTPSTAFPHDYYDVTPEVLYFEDSTHVEELAAAIEVELAVRGEHPLGAEDPHVVALVEANL